MENLQAFGIAQQSVLGMFLLSCVICYCQKSPGRGVDARFEVELSGPALDDLGTVGLQTALISLVGA
ncbi:MAG: hypothetical protein BWY63_03458 [Chloroflexi bacterium ADurb.Bin360]|nr:MAG: hypothetical protein BWY63_03458 [Chloroflexi bacterium ADurb.Bin360]